MPLVKQKKIGRGFISFYIQTCSFVVKVSFVLVCNGKCKNPNGFMPKLLIYVAFSFFNEYVYSLHSFYFSLSFIYSALEINVDKNISPGEGIEPETSVLHSDMVTVRLRKKLRFG